MKSDPPWLVKLCPIRHRPGVPDPQPEERERYSLWVNDEHARFFVTLNRPRPAKRAKRPIV